MEKLLKKGATVSALLLLYSNLESLLRYYTAPTTYGLIVYVVRFVFFIALLSFSKELLVFWYRKHKHLAAEKVDNVIVGITNIHALLVIILVVVFVLGLFQINVRELFASLSIIAAAIAVVCKDYISNLIGGMLVTFSNNIAVGDHIKVGNNKGRVLDISIGMFSLLTDDDDVVTLPNSTVYASEVTNYTKRLIKKTSIEFEISLEAMQTVSQLEQDLIDALVDYRESIKEDSYHLKAVSIKKDAVEFKFQYILNIPDRNKEQEIRKKVIRRVVQIIKQVK